ncbi:hypothetical protein D8674_005872 [Pyrus ussuriensis x Pyrus communis]|uniref:Uncharacterized protein n=1 Tax=Pyrus ussuriensis x Pyrus communis TaxID=2448454 RepID=A0A5N5FSQ1_9ROSA|nr:hypothetical protein D8674_005872 [Pyrus ussuriensis x Pyrus communis]
MFSVSITGVLLIWRSSALSLPALLLLLHVLIHVFQIARIHHLWQPQDQIQFPDIHKLSPVDDGVVFQISQDAILLYGRVDGSMVELEPRFEKTSSVIEIEVLSLHALG